MACLRPGRDRAVRRRDRPRARLRPARADAQPLRPGAPGRRGARPGRRLPHARGGRLRRLVRRRDLLGQRRVPRLALGRRAVRARAPRTGEPRTSVGATLTRRYDAITIGSGINSLAAAALLAKAGWSVCVLERNDWLRGAIRTAEITEPGFVHEVFGCWHPLFTGSAAYAELQDDLEARGLEYLNTELATGTLFPDGESVFL